MKPRYLLYSCLMVLFIFAVCYQAQLSLDLVRELRDATERARSPIDFEPVSPVISDIEPEAQAAGVRINDRLLTVNGRPYVGRSVLAVPIAKARAGDLLTVSVHHDERMMEATEGVKSPEETFTVRLAPSRPRPTPIGVWVVTITMLVVMPSFCLLLGFWVAALRPRDPLAWLLLALLLSFAMLARANLWSWDNGFRQMAIIYNEFFSSAWPVCMMLFGIYFPERLSVDRRWPWLKWVLIIPIVSHGLLNLIVDLGRSESFAAVATLNHLVQPLDKMRMLFIMPAIGVFFAGIGYKQGTASTPDARRRLKLLLTGAEVSLTPMFVLVIISLIRREDIFEGMPVWVEVPALALIALFPLTLAYVIVVHRAMDVRMVIRQGVQYALAKSGVRILQVVLTVAIIFTAVSLSVSSNASRANRMTIIALGILLVLVIRRVADRLKAWTDRRFFREAYNAEQILNELSEKVRTMVETGPLLETVAQRLSESLHVPRVALLTSNNGVYRPAYALGFAESPPVSFPSSATTIAELQREKEPVRVYLDDADSWVYQTPEMNGEREMLSALNTQLLLPLTVKEKLPGFISLGPKQSEEPYSGSDLRLLQSVATQTGLALENSYLTAAIAAEVAQRERLNRELEIAREVQERLFPQNLPQVPGLDYCGACRPALGVGGDYYDFLLLPSGEIGIAIGDVSGKGIAAALLMASLQASLRGQTIQSTSDLGTMIGHVNRLVYEASNANKYATFFYAQYEPGTRRLTYVNAGHNAPMIFRQTGGTREVLRLEVGGAVVGLMPDFPYSQATVTMQPGDLLIGFTDGISEAMNAAEEDYDEPRLIAAANTCDGLSAAETISRLIADVDAFVAGAKQHDDMTLVVVRVVA